MPAVESKHKLMATAAVDIEYRDNLFDNSLPLKTVRKGEEIPTFLLQRIRDGRPEWIVEGSDFKKRVETASAPKPTLAEEKVVLKRGRPKKVSA